MLGLEFKDLRPQLDDVFVLVIHPVFNGVPPMFLDVSILPCIFGMEFKDSCCDCARNSTVMCSRESIMAADKRLGKTSIVSKRTYIQSDELHTER